MYNTFLIGGTIGAGELVISTLLGTLGHTVAAISGFR